MTATNATGGAHGKAVATGMRMTYRAWVDAGARGFFLSAGVAVNATRLINPLDRRGGYFVRRDTRDPLQQERRALLHATDKEDGERDDRRALRQKQRDDERDSERHIGHRHVIAYDNQPTPDRDASHRNAQEMEEGWILTHRVERPIEVVRRGWLTWESIGEVVTRASDTAFGGASGGAEE